MMEPSILVILAIFCIPEAVFCFPKHLELNKIWIPES